MEGTTEVATEGTAGRTTGGTAASATRSAAGFEDVPSRYDGVTLEAQVLALWREHDMFDEAQRASEGRPLYCWNEGPPTANGRPGIHHVLARTFKDIFPRFKHMQGYHCPRKAGWDTHGLPVEHEIEKELEIFDKAEIERQVGVAEFTRRCRESVMRYIGDWERMTERMGFWVNMGDAYYTLDNSFIESVWWLLRQIWDKGLIYQGYKVVPYDPRIGATLSSHEVALGYKEVEDPSIYVRFPVDDGARPPEGGGRASFLVWTTTPWTLPSNLALAVHPEVDYVHVRTGGEILILAEALVDAVLRDAEYTIEKRVKGAESGGDALRPPVRPPLGRRADLPGVGGRLRDHRGRHRHRALRAGLRRGRHPAVPGQGPAGGARGGARRLLRARGRPGGGEVLQGRGPHPRRRSRSARTDVSRRALRAQLPARVAHRRPPHLLREARLVHRDQPHSRSDGGAQPHHQLGAGDHPRRSLRELARQQRRLGALARALLGHTAAGVDRRRGRLHVHRVDRGARSAVRAEPRGGRPAPPRRRRDHLRPSGQRTHVPPRARGHRLLVRLRGDVLRPVPLPVREPGAVRAPLPPPTTSARPSTRPAAGSTRCTPSRRSSPTASPTATASALPTSWTGTARRCRSRSATS